LKGSKVRKIRLEDSGSYLGREKGCLVVKNRKKGEEERYPLFENQLGEVQVRSGNTISAGAIVSMAYWGIPLIVTTARGNPVGVLLSFDNSSHVITRISQYETLKTPKALEIAKQFVISKISGENELLKKYGLRRHDYSAIERIKKFEDSSLVTLRRKLLTIEGHCAKKYFGQIFGLLPESIRPKRRTTFKAYDKGNNLFNVAYTVLSWKVHIALVKARLEPYLGFLHFIQFGSPALVCDFQELYRYLLDDFVIQYATKLEAKDFDLKDEYYGSNRKGKREYLKEDKSRIFVKELNKYFTSYVEVPRVRRGKRQEFESLINEEALLFAKYLRNEKEDWTPRIPAV
jgi:CRISPR-associated protein Cas1